MPYILKLQVVNKDVLPYYEEQIAKRVESAKTNPLMDSGFDLYCPEDVVFQYDSEFTKQYDRTKLVDLGIKAAAYEVRNFNPSQLTNLSVDLCRPYSLKCRSSIYKTNFRLANCEGIIDAGYRGNLKAAVDWHMLHSEANNEEDYKSLFTMRKGARYFQICMPTLEPFKVYIVDKLDETQRGEGGFGSTGK